MKIDIGEYYIDETIINRYVKVKDHETGFLRICKAIDNGGGQTVDIDGLLRELDKAGYKITLK